MNYEIVELEEMKVSGLSVRTTNENMQALADIGTTWQKLITNESLLKRPTRLNEKAIGLYTEYESDFTKPYTFLAGYEVSEHEEKVKELSHFYIQPGKYAKFTVKGDVQKTVIEVWQAVWATDLDRAYTTDFEYYHNDGDMTDTTIDIFIALK